MKVCLVSQEYPPQTGGGGIGTQTYLKAQGLSARGHEVHVVSASWDSQARSYADGKAYIHRIAEPNIPGPGFESSTYWLAYSAAVAAEIDSLSRRIHFDLVQFPEYGGEGFIYQSDTFDNRSARYAVQLHGPLAMFIQHLGWPQPNSTLAEIGCFMEGMTIHRSDLVLASSHCTAKFCAERYGYPLDNIHVVHSGVDVARFTPLECQRDHGFPRVLFVGNLVGNKGFTLVVKAVERLRRHFPRIRLRLIGKGDPEHVQQVLCEARAAENIELVGYSPYDQLPGHYAWADLFAGPSTYEPGPGNVYLEAMACGRPVIACNSGGAPEVVLDRQTGLLIDPGNLDALEHAIALLADDERLRLSLGRNARQLIEQHFSIEKYIDKIEHHYAQVLSRPA